MKYTCSVHANGARAQLETLLRGAAEFLNANMEITETISISTDSGQLADVIKMLTDHVKSAASVPAPTPAPVSCVPDPEPDLLEEYTQPWYRDEKPEQPATTGKTCKYCGAPVAGKAKICGGEECKKAQQREYQAIYKAKKSQLTPAQSEATEMDSTQEEETKPADPLSAWPAGTIWRVDADEMPVYLAQWEMAEKLADGAIPVGTMMTHKHKGLFRVALIAGRYRPVPEIAQEEEATPVSEPPVPGQATERQDA